MSEYPKVTREEFIKGVGNTPLIKIESLSKETGRDIYTKAEFLNSGKSIKDRAAIYLLNNALSKGLIRPGGTLVEATAGNTGFKLKSTSWKVLGAKVIKCPLVPSDDPEFFNTQAVNYAQKNDNCVHVNQMDNLENRKAHFETTGPEIWKQTDGKIDAFIVGCGTGGTFSGVSSYLKEISNGKVKAFIADREGSGLHSYIQSKGDNWDHEGESFVEGVGKLSLTGNLNDVLSIADGSFRALDIDVIITLYRLLDEDHLSVGASGAMNIFCAKQLALTLPKGSVVVTSTADSGERYAGKVFNKEWLVEKGHWDKIPEHLRKYATYKPC
ncbi:unnamed protein product [Wickerhamomyces anomalus]